MYTTPIYGATADGGALHTVMLYTLQWINSLLKHCERDSVTNIPCRLETYKPPKWGLVSYSKLHVSYKKCKLQKLEISKFPSPTGLLEGPEVRRRKNKRIMLTKSQCVLNRYQMYYLH